MLRHFYAKIYKVSGDFVEALVYIFNALQLVDLGKVKEVKVELELFSVLKTKKGVQIHVSN